MVVLDFNKDRKKISFTIMQLGGMKPDELLTLLKPNAPQVRAATLTATEEDRKSVV